MSVRADLAAARREIKHCWNRKLSEKSAIRKHSYVRSCCQHMSHHVTHCHIASHHLDGRCSHPGSQYLPPQSVYSQGCHDRSPGTAARNKQLSPRVHRFAAVAPRWPRRTPSWGSGNSSWQIPEPTHPAMESKKKYT